MMMRLVDALFTVDAKMTWWSDIVWRGRRGQHGGRRQRRRRRSRSTPGVAGAQSFYSPAQSWPPRCQQTPPQPWPGHRPFGRGTRRPFGRRADAVDDDRDRRGARPPITLVTSRRTERRRSPSRDPLEDSGTHAALASRPPTTLRCRGRLAQFALRRLRPVDDGVFLRPSSARVFFGAQFLPDRQTAPRRRHLRSRLRRRLGILGSRWTVSRVVLSAPLPPAQGERVWGDEKGSGECEGPGRRCRRGLR